MRAIRGLLNFLGVIGVILGPGLAFVGWQGYLVRSQSQAAPQQIRAADLGNKGPGDNIHVILTDFEFDKKYVVEEKRGRWSLVWLPVFPKGKAHQAKELRVVVRTGSVRDDAEAKRFLE